MDERAALDLVGGLVDAAGDDAAIVGDTVFTVDMLHEATDFPQGTTRYTAGWRSVAASLSDVAAMGASATAAVGVYAAPEFDESELESFIRGATDVCRVVGGEYVGGDLDEHAEFTVATAAIGNTDTPVRRDSAVPGHVVAVTGTLGRSAAALAAFEADDPETGNDLFRFEPRVAAGQALAPYASAMLDSSDGLARSLHQLAAASDVAISIDSDRIPVDDALYGRVDDPELSAMTFGEDFELVLTLPMDAVDDARVACPVPISVIGDVESRVSGGMDNGTDRRSAREDAAATAVRCDGEPLPDSGWTHGG